MGHHNIPGQDCFSEWIFTPLKLSFLWNVKKGSYTQEVNTTSTFLLNLKTQPLCSMLWVHKTRDELTPQQKKGLVFAAVFQHAQVPKCRCKRTVGYITNKSKNLVQLRFMQHCCCCVQYTLAVNPILQFFPLVKYSPEARGCGALLQKRWVIVASVCSSSCLLLVTPSHITSLHFLRKIATCS